MALTIAKQNKIAWTLLLHALGKLEVRELTRRKLHNRVAPHIEKLPADFKDVCHGKIWGFCLDVVNATIDNAQSDEAPNGDSYTDFELPEDLRYGVGHAFFLCLIYDKGMTVNPDSRDDVIAIASKLNISEKEALSFYRTTMNRIVFMAMKK